MHRHTVEIFSVHVVVLSEQSVGLRSFGNMQPNTPVTLLNNITGHVNQKIPAVFDRMHSVVNMFQHMTWTLTR